VQKNQPLPKRSLSWRARRADKTWWAVRDGNLKYVARKDGDRKEEYLFDLATDPAEKSNLLARRRAAVTHLRSTLPAWEREVQAGR
jgi:hypothetical protein